MTNTIILGVGNKLFSDDGVGVHAVNYLVSHFPEQSNIQFVDGGTLGFSLASYIQPESHLIIIDAMQLQLPAGSVACYIDDEVDSRLQHISSVHEVGVIDLLVMARLSGSAPRHRALIGVQPLSIAWGENLTPPVASALVEIKPLLDEILLAWQATSTKAFKSDTRLSHQGKQGVDYEA